MKPRPYFTGHFSRCYGLPVLLTAALLFGLTGAPAAYATGPYTYTRETNPTRTVVTDASGQWLATFTNGARTVSLRGPSRTFTEPSASSPVVSTTWVRILPAPFEGRVSEPWLNAALADTSPDVLAIATQYVEGAPPIYDGSGLKIAGDAAYGPIDPVTGIRQEGSDFNDYLGIAWTYGANADAPEPEQINSLDCSGFIRMVWGYRSGLPLALSPSRAAIPRRAAHMLDAAPGVIIAPNQGAQMTNLTPLAAGDLVFFDIDPGDGGQIDHVGIYIGRDTGGRYRFISSRRTINGPVFGADYGGQGGRSVLDGTGYWAARFRAVRRL
jgi:cell wall-associated NlpC family hydrolase